MGYHSTLEVSRSCALTAMREFVEVANDDQLSSLLDVMLDRHCYNAMLRDEGPDDDVVRGCLSAEVISGL